MSQATAVAHPNIALVKYWGKRQIAGNLPATSSLSLTLDGFTTTTTVRWGTTADEVALNDAPADATTTRKVLAHLDRIAPGRPACQVVSVNNFPTGAGLASSASAFAALTVAACAAAGQDLDATALSRLARQGSGSACRSLWGGWVQWSRGQRADGYDSHGHPIAPPDHWDLRMVVAVVCEGPKAVGSTEGMQRSAATSPLWEAWLACSEPDLSAATDAVLGRDLPALGAVMERSTFAMHATMTSATPPLLYWQPGTVACLQAVFALRARGIGAWATMDAGPQVKVLCEAVNAESVAQALAPHALIVRVHAPGPGPSLR